MYLAYLDETGNTGAHNDPSQPIHLIGCVLVPDKNVRALEDELATIAEKHFPLVASKSEFEFHGSEIFSGRGVFAGQPPDARIAATKELITAVRRSSDAYGYAGVDKTKSFAAKHPHRLAFLLLLERLEPWLRARDERALIVADDNQEIRQSLIDDLKKYKEESTDWGYKKIRIQNIIDSVHFVRSHNNRIIQAADVLTYFTLKSKIVHNRKISEFLSLPDPRPSWLKWRNANCTRSELATLEIGDLITGVFCFSSKIFP